MGLPEHPHRRVDDSVSWREMVEYVSDQETKWHTARAESLILINNTMEKIDARMETHEIWHRDFLEKMLTTQAANATSREQFGANLRVAVWAVVIAFLTLVVSTAVALLHH